MADEPLRATFFVTRLDGNMVPLVAVDEIPHHIVIAGVSRVMSPFDIAGMTCVGHSDFRHLRHNVHDTPKLVASNQPTPVDALKAKYFIVRDSGNMVPLIAMDEMPEYFVVDGVPRHLSAFDISGMTCVGVSGVRERLHCVEDVKNAPLSFFAEKSSSRVVSVASDSTPSTPTASTSAESPVPQSSASFTPTAARSVYQTKTPPTLSTFSQLSVSDTPSPVPSGVQLPKASGNVGSPSVDVLSPPGVKKYCSYWIRHGECDYQQQGCLYKHEMPTDPDTLRHLGLRDIPKWYRERQGLGSYLAAGGSGAGFADEGLRSAVALGIQDEKKVRMTTNWRSFARNESAATGVDNRRGNIYENRDSRLPTTPTQTSRFSSPQPSTMQFSGKLRSNETLHRRQQFEILRGLDAYEELDGNRTQGPHAKFKGATDSEDTDVSASEVVPEVAHARRVSTSTMMSDIEAVLGRQEAKRKAQEDAEYAKICDADAKKTAAESTDTSGEKSETGKVVRSSMIGGRRGGKGGKDGISRNRRKRPAGKGKDAA